MGERVSALVTGARGFAGAWLCRGLLDAGRRVRTLDRTPLAAGRTSALTLLGLDSEVEQIEGDVRDASTVAQATEGAESVFHLAAQTLVGPAAEDPAETFDVNVRGTWVLLEACRAAEVDRVVVASSDKAYGPAPELPYRESMELRPAAPYEASKSAADVIARSYAPAFGLSVAVTRFANLYGGADTNWSRLVPEAIAAALDGRAPVLRSDGSPRRDLLHVFDAVAAYLAIDAALADGEGVGEAFNAGGGQPHAVGEVVTLITELAGTGVEPDIRGVGNPDGEIGSQWVDASKLSELTGWRARVGLREGLAQAIDWYRANPSVRPS
ncbi:NAD-dependent epimerase/dehydratase family protein [Thermoleophilia bacterium SCSIO 60948]|nr:NAD-dependent epimerase/dehydratase family protein [Thermoleophilia bacterium SCSIO 60948]